MGNSQSAAIQYGVQVPDSKEDGYSHIYRSVLSPDKLVTQLDDGYMTLWDMWRGGVDKYTNKDCFGTRAVAEDGTPGPFEWITYGEADAIVAKMGTFYVKELKLEKGAAIGLFSLNRKEWMLASHAGNRQGLVSVPLYDTLGPDAVEHIVGQAEVSTVICSANHIEALATAAASVSCLKNVISMDAVVPEDVLAKAKEAGLNVVTFDDALAAAGDETVEPTPGGPEDLATVCYTSGTTGLPKGVMLTHANFAALRAGITLHGIDLNNTDVHISYLPLAHMFERAVMESSISFGVSIGFFRGDVKELFADIAELKPTLFPSVPRLFNRFFDKVSGSMAQAGGLKKFLFDSGMASKTEGLRNGTTQSALWDGLLFSKIKAKLGGRVRLVITGSAPLSAEVQDFLMCVFACPVLQGYGMTETCAATNVSGITDTRSGHVGAPLPCTEIRLEDVPDMGYTSADEPRPRGEVLFRGPNITQGYYKNEEKTKEAIDENGWLHSGDIGAWNPDGTLQIIDRKKNLVKLSQGEYIALEYVEAVLSKSPHVLQIMVYGDSFQNAVVAVVVPDAEVVQPWAKSKGMECADDMEALCKTDELKALVMESMTKVGKEAKLRGFEFAKAVHLCPADFTTFGLLTPTFKLKRPVAKEHFKAEIESMYEELKKKEEAKAAAKK